MDSKTVAVEEAALETLADGVLDLVSEYNQKLATLGTKYEVALSLVRHLLEENAYLLAGNTPRGPSAAAMARDALKRLGRD